MNGHKPAWQSKTVWVSIILLVIGAIDEFGKQNIIPEQHKSLAVLVSGILMLMLRFLTGEPITAQRARGKKR